METERQSLELECTDDYGSFELHPFHRNVGSTKKLEQSMTDHGFDPGFPLRCVRGDNGKLVITHGHRRFHVAQKLGLSLWYLVIPPDMDTVEPWELAAMPHP